jgi:tetratricopeptide (TPR) repeat protein
VFSCRHVLDRYLAAAESNPQGFKGSDGQARIQIRSAAASSASAWVDCAIVWQHPARDLVLLQITPRAGQSWDFPKGRLSRLTETGQHPSRCVAMGFPEAEAKPTGLRDSEQVPGWLLPAGAARDPDGLVPFDVDISVPDDAALWEGFSGSAVIDQRTRLIGLVVKAHPARQQRRLLVVPIADAGSDLGFPAAAAAVGLDATVEDYQAPSWRQGVEPWALTARGLPPMVADVEDLRVFGIHVPSSSAARGAPIGYINRDTDSMLDTALAEARSGGRRLVLVTGDSAAGKSRSASQALRRDRVLRGWRLIVPLSDGGLSHLATADLGWQDTVLWLDDLDKYLARGLDLGTVRRVLGDDPAVVVVATMRSSQLQARQGRLTDPAWGFLTDDSEVSRVNLEAFLSDDELQTASTEIFDAGLLGALQEGVGLGEWLVAGPELMKKLNDERGLNRAFADTVIAWYRTGLDQSLAREDAERLWANALSPALRERLFRRQPEEQRELFELASAWACEPVISRDLYEQALITKEGDGYVAHDYVVDQLVRNPHRPTVPDPVWGHALQVATSNPDSEQKPRRIWAVGLAAWQEDALSQAMTAMRTLADTGDTDALLNIGVLFRELGRPEDEMAVYDQVVDRFGEAAEPALREQVAKALVGKGAALLALGRPEEAAGVYDQVVDRYGEAAEPALREQAAGALVSKGAALDALGRSEEAAGLYDQVVDRYGGAAEPALRERAARALVNKGLTLDALGRSEEAAGVYDQVVDRFGEAAEPALREPVARALVYKGVALDALGRPEEEMTVYDQVVDRFGEAAEPAVRERVAGALVYKGIALGVLGRSEEAAGVFDQVVDRFGEAAEPALREQVAIALQMKAEISRDQE